MFIRGRDTVLDAIARAERNQTGHKLSTSPTTPKQSEPPENVQVDEGLGSVARPEGLEPPAYWFEVLRVVAN